MNTREKVLKEALNCVNGEREKQYGNPEYNFKRIAKRWSLYLTKLYEDEGVVIELNPIDVARMMIEFKLARANGPKDKLDNYVDTIGYATCAAEILERDEELSYTFERVAPGTVANKEDFEKRYNCEEPNYKCNRKDCGQFDACMTAYQHYICNKTKEASEVIDKYMCEQKDPYSYAHDKLANYVETKAKEEHVPLDNLKSINRKFPRELSDYLDQASTDCVINGKKFLDCYKEIDELFEKYRPDIFAQKFMKACNSSWKAYANVSDYITSSSRKANVNLVDVVNRLIENEHAPTAMANLLMDGKLGFDDVASYVDDAINEVKKENEK